MPHDHDERARVIAGSPERMAEMAAALDRLRADLDPADVPAHLAEAARRARAEQPPTPLIELGAAGRECVVPDERAARAVSWGWVDPAEIMHAGSRPWGEFGSHRPEQMALITRRLLTAADPRSAAVRTFAEEPMRLDRVQGPAGPTYEVGANGLHRAHLGRLLPLPWVFADIRLGPAAVEDPTGPHAPGGADRALARPAAPRPGRRPAHRRTSPTAGAGLGRRALAADHGRDCLRDQPGLPRGLGSRRVPHGTATDPQRWTTWLTS